MDYTVGIISNNLSLSVYQREIIDTKSGPSAKLVVQPKYPIFRLLVCERTRPVAIIIII